MSDKREWNHACKGTCGGWQDGYEQAQAELERVKKQRDLAVKGLEFYAQYPGPFIVPDGLWDQGLRVQTTAIETLDKIKELEQDK